MKNLSLALVLLSLSMLPSCATSHAVRYSYGKQSFFADVADEEKGDPSRAIFAVPVIIFSLGWDLVTLPSQAVFGVWPWWGQKSLSMDPKKDEA